MRCKDGRPVRIFEVKRGLCQCWIGRDEDLVRSTKVGIIWGGRRMRQGTQEKSRCRALPSDTFEIGECNCFQTSPFEPSAVEVVASKDFEEKTDLL